MNSASHLLRAICVGVGLLLCGLAAVVAILAVMFVLSDPYWRHWQTALPASAALLVGVAAVVTTGLCGVRYIMPDALRTMRLPRLGLVAAVTMSLTIALFAWDVIRTEHRGFYSPETAASIGKPLSLAFTAADGTAIDLANYRGKVVLLQFWATWCPPCRAEMPMVQRVYTTLHPEGFEILGISLDTDRDALNRYLREHDIAWKQYFDGKMWENAVAARFGITAVPQLFLIDKQGRLRDLDPDLDLENRVRSLLAEP
jgi:thiol-disulfide isomerase/thioredoxin